MKKFIIVLALTINSLFFINNCQSQWVQTNGPHGGTFNSFVSFGTNIFVGSLNGVLLSTDSGNSWSLMYMGLIGNVTTLALSGSNLFAGTDGNGVFLSTNYGANWTTVNNGLNHKIISSFAVFGNNLYAGCASISSGKGIYLSTNNGNNWSLLGLSNKFVLSIAVLGSTVYAATNNYWEHGEIYRYTSNDTNWTRVYHVSGNQSMLTLAVSGNDIYAGTAGLLRSTDNGTTWTSLGLSNYAIKCILFLGTRLFVGTGNSGIFVSTNNGINWNSVNNGLTTPDINSITVLGTKLFAGTNCTYLSGAGGIFVSTNNGSNWNSTAMSNQAITSIAVLNSKIFASSHDGGVFSSTNNGTNWNWIGLYGMSINALVVSGNTLFVGMNMNNYFGGGGVSYTTNSGINWILCNDLINFDVTELVLTDSKIFASTYGHGVYLTTNNGVNWVARNNGLIDTNVRVLSVLGTSIFVATSDASNLGYKVFLSTNYGLNWINKTNELYLKYVTCFTKVGADIFAGTNQYGVFKSTNNGTNWITSNSGLSNLYIKSFITVETNILAGTNDGVFLTTNNGANWTSVSQGFGQNTNINTLKIINNYLYAGTNGQSVWRRPLSEIIIGIQNISTEIPSSYSLSQNYPNPFNPSTKIKFSVVSSTHVLGGDLVQLKVYDITGREIQTLVNEKLQPGTYETTFDGSGLISGVYFYRMIISPGGSSTDGYSETKKMIYLK